MTERSRYFILKDRKAVPVRDVLRWGQWFEAATHSGERIIANTVMVNPRRWAAIDGERLAAQAERHREYGWQTRNTIDLRMHAQRILISTVFLGIDHSFGYGAPLLFETMVFNGPLEGAQDRYANWDQAKAGHDAMVARVKDALGGADLAEVEEGGK